MSETVLAAILGGLASPVILKILDYAFGLLNNKKFKEQARIDALEARIDALHKDIEILRNENIALRIKVAENEVRLTLKDEIIARLSPTVKQKNPR